MNREELYMAETYKCDELKKRLKLIVNWSDIKEGQLIFHENDNSIFNVNKFAEYNRVDNLIWYKNKDNMLYNMSAEGWYFYDESVADEVKEYFTPKLYLISSVKYPEDYWFIVSFNEKQLKHDFLAAMHYADMTDEEFLEKYQYEVLKNIDGFEISIK